MTTLLKKRSTRSRSVGFASGVIAFALAGALIVGVPAAQATPPRDSAASAASWLDRELSSNNFALPDPSGEPGTADWGVTIDAMIALIAVGGHDATVDAVVARLQSEAGDFLQWDDPNDMGSKAKLALGLLIADEDPSNVNIEGIPDHYGQYDGVDSIDLIEHLRDSLEPNGQLGSSSNHFDQSLAVLALARTPEGVPAKALERLEEFQCVDPNDENFGGFGYTLVGGSACASVDGDATGIALEALMAGGRTASDASIADSLVWMNENQTPQGSFVPSWDISVGNTNSTGLVGNAARQIGTPAALTIAGKARGFIEGLQITPAKATVVGQNPDSGGGLVTGWIGAIAYSQPAWNAAVAEGIDQGETDQWRRATVQAILALDLPGLGQIERERTTPISPAQLTISGRNSTVYGTRTTLTVTVKDDIGAAGTGLVTAVGAGAPITRELLDGKATFTFPATLAVGSRNIHYSYAGSATLGSSSTQRALVVTKAKRNVAMKITKKPTKKKAGKVTVSVPTPRGWAKASGKVTLTMTKGKSKKTKTVTLSSAGSRSVTLPRLKKGTWRVKVAFTGNRTYLPASKTYKVKVR